MQTEDWSLFWLIYTFKYSWPMNWEGPLTHGGFWWICESEVAQSCPTPCDPMNCSLPGSSVHRIFQARILEWVALSFSRRSSQPRDWTWVSLIVDALPSEPPRKIVTVVVLQYHMIHSCLDQNQGTQDMEPRTQRAH